MLSVAKPVTMDYLFNVKRVLRIFFYNFFTKYFVLLSNISVYQLLFTKKGVGLNFRIVFSSPAVHWFHRSNTGNDYVGTHLVPLVQFWQPLCWNAGFQNCFPAARVGRPSGRCGRLGRTDPDKFRLRTSAAASSPSNVFTLSQISVLISFFTLLSFSRSGLILSLIAGLIEMG